MRKNFSESTLIIHLLENDFTLLPCGSRFKKVREWQGKSENAKNFNEIGKKCENQKHLSKMHKFRSKFVEKQIHFRLSRQKNIVCLFFTYCFSP